MPKASTLATSSPATVTALRDVLGVQDVLGTVNIFDDTTAGIAATVDGDYFSTPSAEDDEYLILYKNESEVATEIKRFPSNYFLQSGTGAVARTMQDKARESVSILDFMSAAKREDVIARTELYDHSDEILAAANFAVANGLKLRAPAGTYMYGGTRLAPTLTDGCSFHLEGDGVGATIFKETDGLTATIGRFNMMWYLLAPAGATVKAITFKGCTLDKNGASSGAPPSSYDWEQAHALAFAAEATAIIQHVVVENVDTLDKVGGGIVFAEGQIDRADVIGCNGRNFSGLFGSRGDFEFQASIGLLNIKGCTGQYVQCEPNASTPTAGVFPLAVIENSTFDSIDFKGYDGDTDAQTVVFNDSKATVSSSIFNVVFKARNAEIVVDSTFYWTRCGEGSLLDDCTIINKYDAGTDSISSFYPRNESSAGGMYLKFRRCRFRPGTGASATTTGYAIKNAATYSGAQPYLVEFDDCEFSSLYQYVLDGYRNGNYVFRKCKLSGRDYFARYGDDGVRYSSLTLDTCDLTNVSGLLFSGVTSGALSTLRIIGPHDYAKFSMASDPSMDDGFEPDGVFLSDSAPTGGGIKGMRVQIRQPAAGAAAEYVCTTYHATAATWKVTRQAGVLTSIASTPAFVGQSALVSSVAYTAVGTSSAADWKRASVPEPLAAISGITPAFVGQVGVVAGVAYMAVGTSSSADWKQITN